MAENFNVDPYYDDFDPSKNFHRILFKPGYAVQARELTQSQTLLQSQISKFADNIFTQNTPVTGGKVTTNLNCYYLKLNTEYNGAPITAQDFLNKIIQDSTGTILAKVIATAEGTGTDVLAGDPPTLIVTYLSGVQFSDAMFLTPTDGTNIAATTIGITSGTTSVGLSSAASISDGVFYVVNGYSQSSTVNTDGTYSKYSIGHFVSVQPQTVILNKYSSTPSYRVGLSITETIVDYISDVSLLDPALGASNYQAPGADRYQINLTLTTLPLALGNDDQFIELLRIENGGIVKQVDGTVYSVIDDYFAKRDYETNGDYVVDDFKLTPSANTSYAAKYDLKVGKGVAYVHGYRIENQSDLTLVSDRARTTDTINNNALFVDYGSYFIVDSVHGTFDVTTMPSIDFHSVAHQDIDSTNVTTYTSTLIGSGYIRNLSYVTNTSDTNTSSYVFKSYVSDINIATLSGTTSTAAPTTITFVDSTNKFSQVNDAYIGVVISITGGTNAGDIRKITAYNGTTKTATVDSAFTVTPDGTSTFSLLFNTKDIESIVKAGAGYTLTAKSNINSSGKVSGIATGDTIFENPGAPEMLFTLGYPYVASVIDSSYISSKVFRSKAFTNVGGTPTITLSIASGNPLRFLGAGALSGDAVKQNFTVVDHSTKQILDFSTSGNNVVVSAGHDSVTFTSATYSGKTVDIITNMSVPNGDSTSIVLKTKTLVTGNTTSASISGPDGIIASNTYIDLTKGQVYVKNVATKSGKISLYVSDVKKIKKIIDTKAPGTAATDAMLTSSTYDVTNLFALDNGQRDNFYDHAALTLLPGAPTPKGNILVVFDYYAHTGGDGYFSIESYAGETYAEIPTYTSKHGTQYRLSDSIDFRPSRENAAITYAFEYTGNPSVDDTGILIPSNLSEYVSNYSYYLARKDKLVLTKDKSFLIIQGTPAVTPSLPVEPDGSLVIANISLDPYTSYIPGESSGVTTNLSINKILHKRWAKSDITDLQSRVNNIEYYTSLSLLEQNAQGLQVSDVNGLNRFKNGILVDDFSSIATADTSNQDYAANINLRTKQLSPITLVDNFQLQNPIVMNSLGTLRQTNTFAVSSINGTHTNVFTLPYTKTDTIVQPLATSVVSLNPFSVAVYQGVAQLNPPMDNWVDNAQSPAVLIADPNIQVYQQTNGVNITNSGDFASIPGTTTSSSTSSSTSRANHGAFNGVFGNNVGQTETTTTTYASQLNLQNVNTTMGYSPVSSIFGQNNGYLTNISILPYIRPQQLIFKVKGLLVNSPVSTWFDGQNIDQYIVSPNTIELSSVSGTFNANDIVGFYLPSSGQFYPTARVVSVYNYPGTSNVRLYIAGLIGAPSYTTTNVLKSALFNSDGNYISSPASGTINAGISALRTAGLVSGVGGSYTPVGGGSAAQIYKVQDPNDWCSFLNQYGVWGDLSQSASYAASFVVNFPTAGTYTFTSSCDDSATVSLDSSAILTVSGFSTTYSTTHVMTAGNHTVSWSATNTGGPAGFALVVTDASGNQTFTTTNPPNLNYDAVAQEVVMPMGGAWFTGVTKLKLDSNSSSVANYYVGAQINITSKYVYQYTTQTATYVPPPPAPSGGGGGGGGGGCFTDDTLVTMADGTTKKIVDVQVGELVFNFDKTKTNKVLFIETMVDTVFETLYSPSKNFKPFATSNHPLYIDGIMSCVNPEFNYEIYPWLGMNKQIAVDKLVPATGKKVYNLWTDGDSTYIVNGYGTTTILGDGGLMRNCFEQGLVPAERLSDLIVRFMKSGKNGAYGSYLNNKFFGKFNVSIINKLMAYAFLDDTHTLTQKAFTTLFKVTGAIAWILKNK